MKEKCKKIINFIVFCKRIRYNKSILFLKEIFERGGAISDDLIWINLASNCVTIKYIRRQKARRQARLEIVDRSVLLLHFYFFDKKIELNVATHLVRAIQMTSHWITYVEYSILYFLLYVKWNFCIHINRKISIFFYIFK